MKDSREFAGNMVLDAVNYSMNKLCKANIIIAGPICSGKAPIADFLEMWFWAVKEYKITVINQTSFYKPLSGLTKMEYGYDVDSLDAFYKDDFVKKVEKLFASGSTSIPYYNMEIWEKGIPGSEKKLKKINVFIGTHAISLLDNVVPNNIKVYLDTDFEVCMKRRLEIDDYQKVMTFKGAKGKNEYFDYVHEQLEWAVAPQRSEADLVVKYN